MNRQDKATRWFITINNPSDADIDALKELDYKFIVIAKENAPSTGTEHIHCLVTFKGQKRFANIKRCIRRADIEPVRGTFAQAYEYVTKDGNIIFESGDKPGKGIGDTFKQMVQEAKAGTIDTESLMYCRYEKFFQRFMPSSDYIFEGDLETKNAWIYGPPGSGKSRLVREYAKQTNQRVYEKLANKWWDCYNGEEIVLMEDLDPKVCEVLIHHIKLWADRYPFRAEVKGGSTRLDPKFKLIVTSNYSLEECFSGPDGKAIARRFFEWEFS